MGIKDEDVEMYLTVFSKGKLVLFEPNKSTGVPTVSQLKPTNIYYSLLTAVKAGLSKTFFSD